MTGLTQWRAEQAWVWGSAPWQNIADGVLSAVHGELVARLAPHPGGCWLDLATGTGAVALRAARAGAQVSALDLSPELERLMDRVGYADQRRQVSGATSVWRIGTELPCSS